VFDFIIKPAMEQCGVVPFRSDHVQESGRISEQMFRSILQETFCVAILTGFNPNVFYELAIAQAANRPTVILLEKGNVLPFDIQDLRCVYYDLKIRSYDERTYVDQLVRHVKTFDQMGWKVTGPLAGYPSSEGDVKLLETARKFGGPDEWMDLIHPAEREILLCGVSLSEWRKSKNFRDVVREKARNGCVVKLLVMDPDNSSLRSLINENAEEGTFEDIVSSLRTAITFFRKLAESEPGVELRLIRTGSPHFNLTLVDGAAVAIQYLYSDRASQSPLLRCKESSSLARKFRNEFESLWSSSGIVE